MADPLRVPRSELMVRPGGYLESARQRRVLLTRRGKVVGELAPIDEPGAAPIRPLLGCAREMLALAEGADLTEPLDIDWGAAR